MDQQNDVLDSITSSLDTLSLGKRNELNVPVETPDSNEQNESLDVKDLKTRGPIGGLPVLDVGICSEPAYSGVQSARKYARPCSIESKSSKPYQFQAPPQAIHEEDVLEFCEQFMNYQQPNCQSFDLSFRSRSPININCNNSAAFQNNFDSVGTRNTSLPELDPASIEEQLLPSAEFPNDHVGKPAVPVSKVSNIQPQPKMPYQYQNGGSTQFAQVSSATPPLPPRIPQSKSMIPAQPPAPVPTKAPVPTPTTEAMYSQYQKTHYNHAKNTAPMVQANSIKSENLKSCKMPVMSADVEPSISPNRSSPPQGVSRCTTSTYNTQSSYAPEVVRTNKRPVPVPNEGNYSCDNNYTPMPSNYIMAGMNNGMTSCRMSNASSGGVDGGSGGMTNINSINHGSPAESSNPAPAMMNNGPALKPSITTGMNNGGMCYGGPNGTQPPVNNMAPTGMNYSRPQRMVNGGQTGMGSYIPTSINNGGAHGGDNFAGMNHRNFPGMDNGQSAGMNVRPHYGMNNSHYTGMPNTLYGGMNNPDMAGMPSGNLTAMGNGSYPGMNGGPSGEMMNSGYPHMTSMPGNQRTYPQGYDNDLQNSGMGAGQPQFTAENNNPNYQHRPASNGSITNMDAYRQQQVVSPIENVPSPQQFTMSSPQHYPTFSDFQVNGVPNSYMNSNSNMMKTNLPSVSPNYEVCYMGQNNSHYNQPSPDAAFGRSGAGPHVPRSTPDSQNTEICVNTFNNISLQNVPSPGGVQQPWPQQMSDWSNCGEKLDLKQNMNGSPGSNGIGPNACILPATSQGKPTILTPAALSAITNNLPVTVLQQPNQPYQSVVLVIQQPPYNPDKKERPILPKPSPSQYPGQVGLDAAGLAMGGRSAEDIKTPGKPGRKGKRGTGKPSTKLTAERNKMKKRSKEDFLTVGEDGDTHLHQAVVHDTTTEVFLQAYLERIKELEIDQVNRANAKNQTPLYLAVLKNKHQLVRVLLKFGADVNTLVRYVTDRVDMIESKGAIHIASAQGKDYKNTLKELLEAKDIDLNLKTSIGRTALHIAVQVHGNKAKEREISSTDIVKELMAALLNQKKDISPVDDDGKTPLMYAVRCGNLALIQAIIDKIKPEEAKSAIEMKVGEGPNCLEIAESMKSSSKVEIWTYLWNRCKNVKL